MPAGQPTLYTDEMSEILLRLRKAGHTLTYFCAHIGICRETAYEWGRVHPKFSDALKKGKELALGVWEQKLESMMLDKSVNAPLVKLYMANCFGWSDKQEATQHINVTTHEDGLKQLE